MSINLSLLDNSMNYVDRAIKDITQGIRENDILQFKYAVIHIFAAIELLMKERLRAEHWVLLFDNINDASLPKLTSGDFKGPAIDKITDRLKGIVAIDKNHLRLNELDQLKKIRNKIQHFSINIDSALAKQIVANGINIFIEFYRFAFDDHDEEYIQRIISEVISFQEFVDVRKGEIASLLSTSTRPYHESFRICSICENDSIVIDENDDSFKCLFCENSFDPKDIAMNISEGPIDELCPNCGRDSIAFILYNNEAGADICVYCDFLLEYLEGGDWSKIKESAYGS